MIEAVKLTKTFGQKNALENVDLQIKEGCIYGLVGSNGSGKSTFMRVVAGIYKEDVGSLTVDGVAPLDSPATKSEILFLPDSPFFFKNANLKEMSNFYSDMYPTFDKERFKYLSSVFPLNQRMPIYRMSKGMQRQAALILALSCNPKYLMLDEAFDGLDPVMRNVLKQLLLDGITKNSMTAIISSHNLRELEDLCDHLILIHEGHIILNNSTEFLTENLQKIQVVFSENNMPDLSKLEILKSESTGSLKRLIIRGKKEDVDAFFNACEPILYESISPSIEEIFIYEMEATGYDVQNILK